MTRSSMCLCGGWGRLSEELRVYTGPNVKDHSYEDCNSSGSILSCQKMYKHFNGWYHYGITNNDGTFYIAVYYNAPHPAIGKTNSPVAETGS